jgi:hypothetical protein
LAAEGLFAIGLEPLIAWLHSAEASVAPRSFPLQVLHQEKCDKMVV